MTHPPKEPVLPTEEELKEQSFEPTHIVTGFLVIASLPNGQQAYLYEGAPLPPSVSEEEADRLVDTGLVRPVRDGKPLDDEEMEAYRERKAAERDEEPRESLAPRTEGRPSPGSPKSEWVDYAVEQHGADREQAEAMTKGQLVDRYSAG